MVYAFQLTRIVWVMVKMEKILSGLINTVSWVLYK